MTDWHYAPYSLQWRRDGEGYSFRGYTIHTDEWFYRNYETIEQFKASALGRDKHVAAAMDNPQAWLAFLKIAAPQG